MYLFRLSEAIASTTNWFIRLRDLFREPPADPGAPELAPIPPRRLAALRAPSDQFRQQLPARRAKGPSRFQRRLQKRRARVQALRRGL